MKIRRQTKNKERERKNEEEGTEEREDGGVRIKKTKI